ncbi:MAG TPA: amidohydrolase family protein [Candidatus Deferrimicrobiaceae bacterium]|nr:amidohydrolase family protein [Candidatus Deferrimicrobiaceae bacterium]
MTSSETLVLSGARIIDGTGAEPVRGRSVVVEKGVITAVVEDARAPRGNGVDLAGHTLLPGLINCHVHLCFGAEADPVRPMREEPVALTALKALLRARETALAGVTTVRDLGGREYVELAARRAIQEGLIDGPRIVAAGRPVCMTGGHGHWLAREADGPDDARKAVREQLKAGADVIKIIATGGVMTPGVEPGSPQLTLEEMRAAIEEARKAGRRTAAHAMAATGISDAIAAGITSIEHGVYLTEEIVAHMRRDGTFLVPTLNAPAAIATGGLAAGIPEYMVRKSEQVVPPHVASFQLAHRAGVRIAAGADSGTPLNFHGSLLPELTLMVKHGMTPLEAIRSATATAADCLGLGQALGRVAPGYAADLIAVAGDPAERIEALGDLRLVLVNGRIILRA